LNRVLPAVLLAVLLAALPASAHVISMSSGFVNVSGNKVEYLLRMPAYEMQQGVNPVTLFDHIRFTSGFETAQRLDGECHPDPSAATLICAANYRFSAPVDKLGVEATFYEITVPNHIHLLRAERDGHFDQAVLDSTLSSATLAFRPPTALETALNESAAGAVRTGKNLAQVFLLVALALAARTRREYLVLFAAFLMGEVGGTAILLRTLWQPPLRFAEAAAALALAYLAFEILTLPKSQGRWILALIFGAFQGMFFALFIGETGYHSAWVLTGAALAAIGVAGICALGAKFPLIVRKALACLLLATGVIWFGIRLRS
jgi:hypothetical protein